MHDAIMQTYGRMPVTMVRGEGARLYDENGKEYLDFTAGIAVTNLGHSHPAITEAISKQAAQLIHCSNLYYNPSQIKLAETLVKHSCMDQVFFCNSGAEANEAAIKLARKYAFDHYGPEKYEIITFKHSFHGRTMGAITATGQTKYQQGFGPLVPGFHYAEAGNLESVLGLINEKTCAIMIEPVQGEGGVLPMNPDFLTALRKLCDEKGILLIFDEIQTGIGRTGTLFAYEQFSIEPDILTLAKGLANGVPIGAMLAKKHVSKVFTPGTHASTFGGNPLATTAALATLDILLGKGYLERVRTLGNYLADRLAELVKTYEIAVEVRGMGLMRGVLLKEGAGEVVSAAFEKGLLLTVAGGNTVRFVPPFVITEADIDRAVSIVDQVLGEKSLKCLL
jgi:acetylornithine/N-succinyldiaminopimelate aminotransferase